MQWIQYLSTQVMVYPSIIVEFERYAWTSMLILLSALF